MRDTSERESEGSHAPSRRADLTPTSTSAVSRYVSISSMRSGSSITYATPRRAGGLPALNTRQPPTHSGSSASSASQSTDSSIPQMQRDSSLSMSFSNDDSMGKYMRELMADLGIEELHDDPTLMPPPPLTPSQPGDMGESLSDPIYPAIGLFRRRHVGLLISVVCASLLTSCLKRGVLPMMRTELQMDAYQADAAEILVMLPWSSMFLIGFVSDVFALFGTHRKSYVVLGWALVAVSLFILSIVSYAHEQDARRGVKSSAGFVNGCVFLLGVACFGGILTVVMAEVYLVAMSKREKLLDRGEVVGTMLVVQALCETLGQTMTNYVVFRITDIGVQPLFTLRQIVTFLALAAIVPMICTALFFHEDTELMRTTSNHMDDAEAEMKPRTSDKVKRHVTVVWRMLQRQSTWRVVQFLVLFVFFSEFLIRYAHLVLDEVCGVSITVTSTGKIIAELLNLTAVFVWRMFLLNCGWKAFAAVGFLGAVWLPQAVYFLLVLYNVSRDVGIYMLVSSMKAFLRGLIVAVEVAMAIEIAPRGAEGATMGVIASVATILRLAATTASNAVSFVFDTQLISENGLDVKLTLAEEISVKRDPTTITLPKSLERRVLLALLVCYAIKLVAVGGIGFMPNQKKQLQSLHRLGTPRPRYALWTIGILSVCLLFAATFNTLVVTPSTSCLKVFGGQGCSS